MTDGFTVRVRDDLPPSGTYYVQIEAPEISSLLGPFCEMGALNAAADWIETLDVIYGPQEQR